MRATKLVCTLGPATAACLPDLIEAGMDVARINLSHGDRSQHEELLRSVREAAREAGRAVGVMADLSGPKVRLGRIEEGEVRLERGAPFLLRADGGAGDAAGVSTSYPGLAGDLEPGDRILLADGAAELRVTSVEGPDVATEVIRPGRVRSRAGVNVPAERLGLPAITAKDEDDAAWCVRAGIDLVAQSFVRSGADVRALRDLLGRDGPHIVAKIETEPAVRDAQALIEIADAIMVARGDLGVELPLEQIPLIQRDLVARAARAGRPVIVATQMLESMTRASRPTRAEVSDVAEAVLQGADAIMLSAETAVGEYPIDAARTAARIAMVAGGSGLLAAPPELAAPTDAHLIAQAAARISRQGGIVAAACFTQSGLTASLLSAARPRVPIYAFSPSDRVVQRLTLLLGVAPFLSDAPDDTDSMIAMAERHLLEHGRVRDGDAVVMVGSSPFGEANTNLLKIHRVGV